MLMLMMMTMMGTYMWSRTTNCTLCSNNSIRDTYYYYTNTAHQCRCNTFCFGRQKPPLIFISPCTLVDRTVSRRVFGDSIATVVRKSPFRTSSARTYEYEHARAWTRTIQYLKHRPRAYEHPHSRRIYCDLLHKYKSLTLLLVCYRSESLLYNPLARSEP